MSTATGLLFLDLSSTSLTPDERELLASRRFAGLTVFARNVQDRFQLADYLSEVRELAGDDFIVATDQEGGRVLRVLDLPYPPAAMALGAADDAELTREVARATARGLRSTGINVDFAPVADLNVNPLNPVIADRAFGTDPEAVSRHVSAFVTGLQDEGVAATVKHFPGHGDTSLDSHLALPKLERSAEELRTLELRPFAAALASGAAAVMTAHIVFSQLDSRLPATLSPVVLRELLRDGLGFAGVVFSDALDMKAIADHYSPVEANLLALQAGVDAPLNIGPVTHHLLIADGLEQALREGRLDPELLASARARLQHLAQRFPARPADPESAWQPGDEQLLDGAAARGLVKEGELPLLAAGEPVTIVSAEPRLLQSATQQLVDPAGELAALLRSEGFQVELVTYPAGEPAAAHLGTALDRPGSLLFISPVYSRLEPAEQRFAAELAAARAGRYVSVLPGNPYHSRVLPGPALFSFGFRPASLRAIARALQGAPVTGSHPY